MDDARTASRGPAIGSSLPRLEADDKASGRARYADDVRLPGMLHAALLTSPHAHARIVARRVAAARAIPGVKAILTGADLTGPLGGGIVKDESMVARDKVRYVGEPVAAVAAVDAATAQRALEAIEIDYEPLVPVLSIDEALAPGAPILHEGFGRYVKTIEGGGAATSSSRVRSSKATWIGPSASAMSSSRGPSKPRRSIMSTWRLTAASPMSTRAGGSRCT